MDPNEIKGVPTGDSKPCWHDRVTMQFQFYDEREPADNPYYKSARQEIALLEEVADTVDSLKQENQRLKADAERAICELKIKADRVIQLELENRQIRGENATLRLSNEEYYEDKKTHRDWSEMAKQLKKENELLLDANKLVNEKCEVLRDENQQFRADNAELLKVHKQMVERFDDSLKRGLMLVRSIENLSATVARLTADK
jgi:hypothetical protein